MKKQGLLMPNFLKPDFSHFNFDFIKESINNKDEKFKQELLLVYGKKNTILILDGKVIYKNLADEIEVSTAKSNKRVCEYLKKQTTDFLKNENKKYLNSQLVLAVKCKGKKHKINIVYGFTKQIYHATFLDVEKQVDLDVFEKVIGIDEAKANITLEILAKEDAVVKYTSFYDINSNKTQVFTKELSADKDTDINLLTLNLNSANTLDVTNGQLVGQGANIKASSLSFLNRKSVLNSLIVLDHRAPNSTSKIDNIAVVNDFARVQVDGVGKINQGFSKASAKQKNRFITLKESAKVIVNPQLIINEFDVEAGHAATVGNLDKDKIYYMQSRGLTKEKATQLLLLAEGEVFLNEFTASEKNQAIRIIKEKIK